MVAVATRDHLADGGIVDLIGGEGGAQSDVIAGVQPAQAFEVAGRPDVHRIGQRRHARRRRIGPAGEEVGQHPVGVGGQGDASERHPQRAGKDRGQRIAQVARGHDEIQRSAGGCPVAQRRMRVVAHLRQQAAQADAVGGTERGLRLQLGVVQRALHQRLAVVERTRHAQRHDVVPEAAQLVGLARRYAAIRIQHHHAQAGLAVECRGYGRTGIAGRRHQDRQRRVLVAAYTRHAGGQEARTEILECHRGPVEQLQHVVVRRTQWAQRRREIERLPADRRQFACQRITGEERRQQRGGS